MESEMTDRSRKYVTAFAFLLPALAGLVIFRILPLANAFIGSLFQVDYAHDRAMKFTGLKNFANLFTDLAFWDSVKITILFNLIVNPLQIALALFMALLVQQNTRVNRFFRSFYMLPLGVSLTVASAIWAILLNPNNGLINGLLRFAHISAQPFLTSSVQAMWCIILVSSWYGISYWLIFLLAGLQDISPELYEAAVIDGARSSTIFWRITLPMLKKVLLFVIVADTSANFLLFAPIYVLTKGGPQGSTNTLMYEMFTSVFVYSDLPRGLTICTVLLILLLVVVLFEFRLFNEKEKA
jgi:multiple sugar transport system permease protein